MTLDLPVERACKHPQHSGVITGGQEFPQLSLMLGQPELLHPHPTPEFVSSIVTEMGFKALQGNKKKVEDKKIRRRGLRLWIDPALLPTRLAQRVREPHPPANRWIKKTETITDGRYLSLADAAFKDGGYSTRREQVLLTRLL